jgi:DNA-binding MarR family transcriptional regulator
MILFGITGFSGLAQRLFWRFSLRSKYLTSNFTSGILSDMNPDDRACAEGDTVFGEKEACGEKGQWDQRDSWTRRDLWTLGDDAVAVPADAPLPALIVTATRLMGAFYGGTVRTAGVRISPAGLGVLRVLLESDGLKASEVAARGGSSPGTLTAVVNSLAREGCVQRRPDPSDRRVVRLHVTDRGREACRAYADSAGPKWRHAFDFLDAEDEPVVRRFFMQMIEQFGKLVREERGT